MQVKEMLTDASIKKYADAINCANSKDSNGWKSIEDPWAIIGKYFDKGYLERLVEHQIETFDDFTNIQIEKTINMFNPVNINGRKYLDQAEVARFWDEAKGGKYAEKSNLSERPPHE